MVSLSLEFAGKSTIESGVQCMTNGAENMKSNTLYRKQPINLINFGKQHAIYISCNHTTLQTLQISEISFLLEERERKRNGLQNYLHYYQYGT